MKDGRFVVLNRNLKEERKRMRVTRNKFTGTFPAIMVHIYGLVAAMVACMYIWQLFLTEMLSAVTRALIEKVEAFGANLPPEQREATGLSFISHTLEEVRREEISFVMTETLKEGDIEGSECTMIENWRKKA